MSSHHHHNHKNSQPKFRIKNVHLVIAALTIVAGGLIVWQVSLNNSNDQWVRLQKQLAGTPLDSATSTEISSSNLQLPLYITVPVLMYHHVGTLPPKPDAVRIDLTVPTQDFEQEVQWLSDNGYHTITLGDILLYSEGKFKLPDKPVIFTFDDGYQDVFDDAVPILKKYGFVGDFGIITQFPGLNTGDNQYATWATIKDAQKQGMEIVSHTQDHFDGTNSQYSDQFILDDLNNAQKDIQSNLGTKPLPILIYPYGHYDQRYLKLAEKAGISMGLTEHVGKKIYFNDLMETPRVRVHGVESLDEFERNVQW